MELLGALLAGVVGGIVVSILSVIFKREKMGGNTFKISKKLNGRAEVTTRSDEELWEEEQEKPPTRK